MQTDRSEMRLVELLYRPNDVQGYNFPRTIWSLSYMVIYKEDLAKRVQIGDGATTLLIQLYEATVDDSL